MTVLRWLGSIFGSVLNSVARFVALLLLVGVTLAVIGMIMGDGVPGNTVLTLDLRKAIANSSGRPSLPLMGRPATVMDLIFALDDAGRDKRIKGMVVRLGDGGVALSQAEELSAAFARFRAHGKFIIAQATSFEGPGLGDYLAASAADQIWVQPKSTFAVAGAGAGEIFLRGLFDKLHADPQMAKRAEYKSAADMYTEKGMSGPDKEQLNAVMQSWYDAALNQIAGARHRSRQQVQAAFEASPQFAEDAKAAGLLDRLGYDDDALAAAMARAGSGAKLKMTDYIGHAADAGLGGANIAVIEAAGEIADGTASGSLINTSTGIASDDLSEAIRQATRDNGIKAIVLRVDSPGGSVTASDQILDAVKKAQAKGKPVVVSMGELAASGGYYISASADSIVAEPATLTGSIGVLTGKVSFGGTADLIGVKMDEVSIGKNTLMDSITQPFTPDQWTALNHEADVIYDDFLHKVSAGRKLPFAQVADVARGRVWTGADAKTHGLVNDLGGFWTAADLAAKLGKVPGGQVHFRVYPRPKGVVEGISRLLGGAETSMATLSGLSTLLSLPPVHSVTEALEKTPARGIELRAPELEQFLGN